MELEQITRFTRLWTQAQRTVLAFVSTTVTNFADAEDVLQKVSTVAVSKFDEFSPSGELPQFLAWTLAIARYEILNHLRTASSDRHKFSSEDPDHEKLDTNFQGFGRFMTNAKGEYYFRTIKPRHYRRRTSHIHRAVKQGNSRMLTTQIYAHDDPKNKTDRILNSVRDPQARDLLIAEYKPIPGSKAGELAVNFDVVIGTTPEDPEPVRERPRPRR